MTPTVIIEGDKVVLVLGVDRLELDANHAEALSLDLVTAVRRLRGLGA